MVAADPINPQRVFWELSPRLPENCILTADSGSAANWYARDIKIRRGMKASLSGGLASLGAATPYAMAAKMAFPDRTVIGFIGDGAMQMNGLNVMITVSKYWREWSNPHFIIMVLNNRDLNQVTWEERVQLGEGKTELTQAIPDFPYHKYAELIGLKGIFCNDPEKIGAAWDEALAADRPVILEMYTDPNVPPLPPHITLKDAKNFMTMMKDEPELGSVLKNSRQAGPGRHHSGEELSRGDVGQKRVGARRSRVAGSAAQDRLASSARCARPAGRLAWPTARRGGHRPGRASPEPGGRDDRRLGAGRQCDGALPRRLPQQGDVDAHRLRRVVARGQPARPYRPTQRRASGPDAIYAAAGLTGIVGTGFHLYNITKKPGGFCWQNLFYSAPIGAPAALSLSGADGLPVRAGARQPARHAADCRRHAGGSGGRGADQRFACSARWVRPACCISAAPTTTLSCCCRYPCRQSPPGCWQRRGRRRACAASASPAGGCARQR